MGGRHGPRVYPQRRMKSANPCSIHPKHLRNADALRRSRPGAETPSPNPTPRTGPESSAARFRTTPRDFVNPVDYRHPYDSMGRFAKALALRYDANRTRPAYYRQLRLIHNLSPGGPGEAVAGAMSCRRAGPIRCSYDASVAGGADSGLSLLPPTDAPGESLRADLPQTRASVMTPFGSIMPRRSMTRARAQFRRMRRGSPSSRGPWRVLRRARKAAFAQSTVRFVSLAASRTLFRAPYGPGDSMVGRRDLACFGVAAKAA